MCNLARQLRRFRQKHGGEGGALACRFKELLSPAATKERPPLMPCPSMIRSLKVTSTPDRRIPCGVVAAFSVAWLFICFRVHVAMGDVKSLQ